MHEDVGAGSCPECGTPLARPDQLVCQGCFVPFALLRPERGGAADDPEATDALPQLGPDAAGAPAAPRPPGPAPHAVQTAGRDVARALSLCFPDGQSVLVRPGTRIRIGRDPRACPEVRFLTGRDNLSRVHATFVVEADGSAWITDEGSTNGTFVHGYRLAPLEPAALRPGDSVRLAADVVVQVLLP